MRRNFPLKDTRNEASARDSTRGTARDACRGEAAKTPPQPLCRLVYSVIGWRTADQAALGDHHARSHRETVCRAPSRAAPSSRAVLISHPRSVPGRLQGQAPWPERLAGKEHGITVKELLASSSSARDPTQRRLQMTVRVALAFVAEGALVGASSASLALPPGSVHLRSRSFRDSPDSFALNSP